MKIVKNNFFQKRNPQIINFMRSWDPLEVLDFHQLLGNKTTPLIHLPHLAKKLGIKNIIVKDESQRLGLNSFKALGASYAMAKQLENNPDIETFCTATDGNHGRSVAWMARKLNRKSIVYVPRNTSKNRIEAIRNEHAEVYVTDNNYDITVAKAQTRCDKENKIARKNVWSLVQDTAWDGYEEVPLQIMKGYWTQIHEITEQIISSNVDVLFLQAGVGSWAASIASYIAIYWKNPPMIITVEPLSANCVYESIKTGKRVSINNHKNTIMAGLNCGTVSKIAWKILKNYVHYSLAIPDAYTKRAMRLFAYPIKDDKVIIAGESGVGGMAGLLAYLEDKEYMRKRILTSSSTALIINTEGDTDSCSYNKIIRMEDKR